MSISSKMNRELHNVKSIIGTPLQLGMEDDLATTFSPVITRQYGVRGDLLMISGGAICVGMSVEKRNCAIMTPLSHVQRANRLPVTG